LVAERCSAAFTLSVVGGLVRSRLILHDDAQVLVFDTFSDDFSDDDSAARNRFAERYVAPFTVGPSADHAVHTVFGKRGDDAFGGESMLTVHRKVTGQDASAIVRIAAHDDALFVASTLGPLVFLGR